MQDITQNNIGFQIVHQNRRETLLFPLFKISTSKHVQRKATALSRFASISKYYYRSYDQYYMALQKSIF